MKNFTFYLAAFFVLLVSQLYGQETFESRAKTIAFKIEQITKEEKKALEAEIESVNQELEKNLITADAANQKKTEFAAQRAKNIEQRVGQMQEELRQLVQEKVDGKIVETDSSRTFIFRLDPKRHKERHEGERRTTSQFVFAFGLNNLVTNESVAHSDYKVWGSHFYEWGVSWNTRILKNHNLLHAKYGLSLMYNNLRPTENRFFVEDGNLTKLQTSTTQLDDSRFRNVYLVMPVHLEFDFTPKKEKNGKTVFRTHRSFRMGLGGYVGGNIKSKQILRFDDESGNDVRQRTRGDFNVNDFIYGASAYIGYREVSLYAKYDLNPLFRNNAVDQRNISMGIRFDLN